MDIEGKEDKQFKVLIVEDDPMVAMINEQYVCKNKNFTVVKSCRNGQEAIDFLTGATPVNASFGAQSAPASPSTSAVPSHSTLAASVTAASGTPASVTTAPGTPRTSATEEPTVAGASHTTSTPLAAAPHPGTASDTTAPDNTNIPSVPAPATAGSPSRDGQVTPDLIIMDVFMPYMNGIETLKKIRELKIASEVIMVTAANDTATLEETMHLGVLDFLIKPFAYERFQVALEKFAAKAKTLRTTPSVIDQSYVDSLISGGSTGNLSANSARPGTPGAQAPASAAELPKGIQQKTLDLILNYFKNHSGWIAGDKVAEDVGLSCVTIRHYMSYLVERGDIRADINYSTGGRPSMLYSKAKSF